MKKFITHKTRLFIISTAIALTSILTYSFTNSDFEIAKNLDIFATLYKELNRNYVEETDPGKLMEKAIDEMLKSLDPYTVYIPESDIEDYKLMTTGIYGGIGALIHKKDGNVVISQPYEGFPAEKKGLMAGDKIIKIDGKEVKSKPISEVSSMLKGQSGTEVEVVVERYGSKKPIKKTLVRENVKIDNVPYYGMLHDSIGYIKLTDFTKNAAKEVKEAFLELRKNHHVSSVIIDLRGNGGGLLDEAVRLSNIFIPKGELIVSTKGKLKSKNSYHKTNNNPVDKDIPLAVLVDRGSASASEIFAGAMQDLDRGVVVGKRTFGKGLVQNVVPLSYNSKLKVTVAKYYIPSGRCIQAIDYANRNEDGSVGKVPDSLISEFTTKNGRKVYDGGGIRPDISSEKESISHITRGLIKDFMIFDYATKFRIENPEIPSVESFKITDSIYNDFKKYISKRNFDYTTDSEKQLEKLKETAKEEKYFKAIGKEFSELEKKLMHDKNSDLLTYKDEIKFILKEHIIMRYYYQTGAIKASLNEDPGVEKAVNILLDKDKYNNILSPAIKSEETKN